MKVKLNPIHVANILIGALILCAVLVGIACGLLVFAHSLERSQEIYYPKDMPMEWERIPGTNYMVARTFENKRDTVRINKTVTVNYTYQILTIGEKKLLRDSLRHD